MSKIFVDACLGKETPYTPVWMMRQAGRYLPEYMKVRAEAGSFLDLCHDPEKAAEVTLQPVDIVGVDAAILFSDILVIPDEMGMDLSFVKGEGPKFSDPITSQEDLDRLIGGEEAAGRLTYVYDTIKLIKERLADDKALIGFTGAPWTLATYMIEGQGTKTYNICKKMMYTNPGLLHNILAKVTEVVKLYMEKQIESGIDVVQIFDSWAAAIEPGKYDEFSWKYMIEIADYLKAKYPHIPIIMFPKGIPAFIERGLVYGNFDVCLVSTGVRQWHLPKRNWETNMFFRATWNPAVSTPKRRPPNVSKHFRRSWAANATSLTSDTGFSPTYRWRMQSILSKNVTE